MLRSFYSIRLASSRVSVTPCRYSHSLLQTVHDVIQSTQSSPVGTVLAVKGHIRSIKFWKTHGFIDISDGTTSQVLNIILGDPKELSERKLKVGQSIEIVGEVVKLKVKDGVNEILCSPVSSATANHKLELIGDVPENYPIQKKKTSLEFLRTLPTLRHRTATVSSVFRFRLYLESAFNDFFQSEQCIKVSPPIITASDCEGAGELFTVKQDGNDKFFDSKAFLTVSTQLHLEVLAPSLNRVWTLTPCFRAENSDTNRHLSEFWMLEAELCYIDDVKQLTEFSQRMIQHVVKKQSNSTSTSTYSSGFDDLFNSYRDKQKKELLSQRWETLSGDELWPTITYDTALDILNTHKPGQAHLPWGATISTEHEKWLAGSHFKGPVFITDYPKDQKPFYMKNSRVFNPEKPTVACYDLIIPEVGELIGGSLRIHDYDELIQEIEKRNMNKQVLDWYISLRENGTVPHGGFGMGFERLIMYLSAQDNIRDVIPFPRFPGNCKC